MNYKPPELYSHQNSAFTRFKDSNFFALFMEMGTGKSRIALEIAKYKYDKGLINAVLIIAPNNVHRQWAEEQIPLFINDREYSVFTWSSRKDKSTINKRNSFIFNKEETLKFFCMNVEAFRSKLSTKFAIDYLTNNSVFTILDEATTIKSPKSLQSKNVRLLFDYPLRYNDHRCILTGTPVSKNPFSLWTMFDFLKKNYFNMKYFNFQNQYGIMMRGTSFGRSYRTLIDEATFARVKLAISKIKNRITINEQEFLMNKFDLISLDSVKAIDEAENFIRFKNLDALKNKINNHTLFLQKKDCLDLPEKIYMTRFCDMVPEQKKLYTKLKKDFMAEFEGQKITVQNKLVLLTRLMQLTGGFLPGDYGFITINPNPKIQALLNLLEDVDEKSVIIWSSYRKELLHIIVELENLGHTVSGYFGGLKQEERDKNLSDFKKGNVQFLVANPRSAGYGLNLQNCSMQIFFSSHFRTEDRLQAEDRIHRMGQKNKCTYIDLIMRNSVDIKIRRILAEGKNLNNFFSNPSLESLLEDYRG